MSVEFSQVLERIDSLRTEIRAELKDMRKELKDDMQRTRHDLRDEMGGRIGMTELRLDEAEKKIDEVHTKVATNTGRDRVILWGGAALLTGAVNWLFKALGGGTP